MQSIQYYLILIENMFKGFTFYFKLYHFIQIGVSFIYIVNIIKAMEELYPEVAKAVKVAIAKKGKTW